MTGDAYKLPIQISTTDGIANLSTFKDIEVMFGTIRKTLANKEIEYDEERQMFLLPLTQQETFRQKEKVNVQIRCKFEDGSVIGIDAGEYDLAKATSKVVL